jgi:endonuclease/exonuclease/phosphatase family metal-dependent hydrolase
MKVITFNLRNFTDDHWDQRRPLMVQDMIRYDADVLAFQEVRGYINNPDNNMAKQIQEDLQEQGVDYPSLVVQQAMPYPDQGVWEGLAIMAKVDIAKSGYKELTLGQGSDSNKRIVLWAQFDVENGTFYVFNNHFSYDENQAMLNAQEVIAYVNPFDGPGLLVGDLNTTPDSDVVQYIADNGWQDVWEAFCPDDDGFTFRPWDLIKRIDYLWINKYWSAQVFVNAVQSIERIFTRCDHDSGEYPSDHLGLMTAFTPATALPSSSKD